MPSCKRHFPFYFLSLLFTTALPDSSLTFSQEIPVERSGVKVFASADDASLVLESVSEEASLSPIAAIIATGGTKWYMVRTPTGNIGWMKAAETKQATKLEGHFRSLPTEITIVEGVKGRESASKTPSKANAVIPVQIRGSKVIVSVLFNNNRRANLLLDTGASQTMISKRVAQDLRLYSSGSGKRYGIGGAVTVSTAVIDSVKVGQAEIQQLQVSIHDFSVDPSYEGLLGFDFLRNFRVSLDLQQSTLLLSPANNNSAATQPSPR